MCVKYLALVIMSVTVFGVSGDFAPEFIPGLGNHFGGDGFFHGRVPMATLPQYIVEIFRSKHFPFYRQGSGGQYFGTESYPINFQPGFLQRNKPFGFERYTSYLSRVFGPHKNAH